MRNPDAHRKATVPIAGPSHDVGWLRRLLKGFKHDRALLGEHRAKAFRSNGRTPYPGESDPGAAVAQPGALGGSDAVLGHGAPGGRVNGRLYSLVGRIQLNLGGIGLFRGELVPCLSPGFAENPETLFPGPAAH